MLCTLEDVRVKMNIDPQDTSRDDEITAAIADVPELFRNRVGREFVHVEGEARSFDVAMTGDPVIVFDRDDLAAVDSIVLHPGEPEQVTLTTADWRCPARKRYGVWTRIHFEPTAITASERATRFGEATVTITGDWGFPEVPGTVRDAAVKTVIAWLRRDVQALGQFESEFQPRGVTPVSIAHFAIPGDVWSMLVPFMKLGAY